MGSVVVPFHFPEEEKRWDYATSTRGMNPLQALELVRGFAATVQESNPDAQREVIQRVSGRIAIRDDQVVDVDVYPVYAEAFVLFTTPSGLGGANTTGPSQIRLRQWRAEENCKPVRPSGFQDRSRVVHPRSWSFPGDRTQCEPRLPGSTRRSRRNA
jgi:hypothetical protein